jgi:hypothetical protein
MQAYEMAAAPSPRSYSARARRTRAAKCVLLRRITSLSDGQRSRGKLLCRVLGRRAGHI